MYLPILSDEASYIESVKKEIDLQYDSGLKLKALE
jgi:hypothetical protein